MPPARRQTLGEVTYRVNNSQDGPVPPRYKASTPLPHHERHRPSNSLQGQSHTAYPRQLSLFQVEPQVAQDCVDFNSFASSQARRPDGISSDFRPRDPKRCSDLSNSTDGSGGRKKDVGPWNLGKTLGQGATARVRKARHRYTAELAAVKIVQKKDARMSQAGSLAALDHLEATMPDDESARQMPLGIEREVAIMKLIDHPHVMKLHDIWENRTEIYLVLEFVDNGELFDYITSKGRLKEKEAIKFWRQILSAVGYCHSFNICHRDLKPENILLTKEGSIKIADFGMAALTQTHDHRLNTSCGSPHYAAPEIISGSKYAGNKVDIWSMGVILYAVLAGTLPFDHPGPGLQGLLALVRRGQYKMSPEFTPQAKDLIARILRLSPQERPTIQQIWKHPLLRKYDYLDNLNTGNSHLSPSVEECGQRVERVSDIDRNLLRHLRSMWHMFNESQLIAKLMSEEPNEQKRFYALLLRYKESQREDYHPELEYSNSDYHHARPLNQVRKFSTRQFVQPAQNGHGPPQISCFTVIGNGSRDPRALSYDPFNASKLRAPNNTDPGCSDSTTPQPNNIGNSDNRLPAGGLLSLPQRRGFQASSASASSSVYSHSRPPGRRGFTTRSSLASSTRSRGSTSGVVKATVGHKRGVSFSHTNRSPPNDIRAASESQAPGQDSLPSEATDAVADLRLNVGGRRVSGRYIRSKKTTGALLQPILKRKSTRRSGRFSRLWEDDVRQVSTSLEIDCDKAFYPNSLTAGPQAVPKSLEFRSKITSAQFSSFRNDDPHLESSPRLPRNLQAKSGKAWWDQRPLPRPPARSESTDIELAEARKHAESRKALGNIDESPGHLDRQITHIDHLMHPTPSPLHPPKDRRTRSAPVPRNGDASKALAPIEESSFDGMPARSGSDLESQTLRPTFPFDDRATRLNARQFHPSIRVVPESSPVSSPMKPTAPLRIKKQSRKIDESVLMTGGLGVATDQEYQSHDYNRREAHEKELVPIDDYDDEDEHSNGTIRHKGAAWFKRSSRSSNDENVPPIHDYIEMAKKSFGFGTLFKKRGSRNEPEMVIALDAEDTTTMTQLSLGEDARHAKLAESKRAKDLKAHQSEPHQNWIARLFKVKPAKRYICCAVSRRRARQEIVTIFKEWKRYGLTDIIVDKARNIVYARVQTPNSLQVKEVSFAAEIMTVVEHGSRYPLSIIRITQEKGAASSLNCVADKLKSTMLERGMLVSDKHKAKMMIKTLSSGEQEQVTET